MMHFESQTWAGRLLDADGNEVATCGHDDHPNPGSAMRCAARALRAVAVAAVCHPSDSVDALAYDDAVELHGQQAAR